jgi:hypothetical protein
MWIVRGCGRCCARLSWVIFLDKNNGLIWGHKDNYPTKCRQIVVNYGKSRVQTFARQPSRKFIARGAHKKKRSQVCRNSIRRRNLRSQVVWNVYRANIYHFISSVCRIIIFGNKCMLWIGNVRKSAKCECTQHIFISSIFFLRYISCVCDQEISVLSRVVWIFFSAHWKSRLVVVGQKVTLEGYKLKIRSRLRTDSRGGICLLFMHKNPFVKRYGILLNARLRWSGGYVE